MTTILFYLVKGRLTMFRVVEILYQINDVTSCSLICREMAIKFNDYFEFPREFDMAPYTAKDEGEGVGLVCSI